MTWELAAVAALGSVFGALISQGFGYAKFRGNLRVTGEAALWKRIAELEAELRRVYELLRKSGEDCDERVHQAIEDMREEMRKRLEWDGDERRRERRALNGEWDPFPDDIAPKENV